MISTVEKGSVDAADMASDVNEILWTCSLGSNALSDFNYAIRLGFQLTEKYPQCADCWNTVGVLLYRAGKYQLAVDRLKRSVSLRGSKGTLWDYIFLAMAYQQLGQSAEAQFWEQRAGEELSADGMSLASPNQAQGFNWEARLELKLFVTEMKTMSEAHK
jgi:tetratricopeptide (TPR) repeat protein